MDRLDRRIAYLLRRADYSSPIVDIDGETVGYVASVAGAIEAGRRRPDGRVEVSYQKPDGEWTMWQPLPW